MIVGITCGGADLEARVRDALAAGIDHVLVREDVLPAWVERVADPRIVLHRRMGEHPGFAVHYSSAPQPWGGVFSVSTHSVVEAERAMAAGARWVLLSPIWPSPSKPGDRRPALGTGVLATPGAVALGGVSTERVALCRAAGAAGVAGMGGIFGARDVAEAVGQWRAAWDQKENTASS